MIFTIIKVLLIGVVIGLTLLIIKKRKKKTKAGLIALIVAMVIVCTAVGYIRLEKLVTFPSAETGFKMCFTGRTADRVDGENSCLFVSDKGMDGELFRKTERGWRCAGRIDKLRGELKTVEGGMLYLYKDEVSGDTYAFWTMDSTDLDGAAPVFTDTCGNDLSIYPVIATDDIFVYNMVGYVAGDPNEYRLIVDGEIVPFKD